MIADPSSVSIQYTSLYRNVATPKFPSFRKKRQILSLFCPTEQLFNDTVKHLCTFQLRQHSQQTGVWLTELINKVSMFNKNESQMGVVVWANQKVGVVWNLFSALIRLFQKLGPMRQRYARCQLFRILYGINTLTPNRTIADQKPSIA